MQTDSVLTIAQIAGAAVVALLVIATGLQQLIKTWKSNSTEGSLLQMMHVELGRMSTQNSTLSEEVGKLQIEIISLSNQLTRLTTENQKLQNEVANLNGEVSILHGIISKKELGNDFTVKNKF